MTKLKLEAFSKKHLKLTFEWISNPDLRRRFLMRGGNPSWEQHLEYSRKVLNDVQQRVYAILVNGKHVGNCGFKNLRPLEKEGELWIYIGEGSYQGKGIGAKAVRLLLREGFEKLKLGFICLHVAEFNAAARRIYEKFEFKQVPLSSDEQDAWSDCGAKVLRMELRK